MYGHRVMFKLELTRPKRSQALRTGSLSERVASVAQVAPSVRSVAAVLIACAAALGFMSASTFAAVAWLG
ncbi:MAG: hypothetical protein AAFU68_04060 [Pseudomonadota bacterium]